MYFANRPFKCLRRWIGTVMSVLIFAALFLSFSVLGVGLYFQWIIEEITWINIAGIILYTAALVYFGWFQLLRNLKENFCCRIVPYFEQRLGTCDGAFETGIQLCRQCRRLDELAMRSDVPTLSSFGFRDDGDGEKLKWYDATDGLRTVETLSALTEGMSSQPLLNDLKRLENVLRDALKQEIRFCLIVRAGLDKFINPIEMDRRKGYFW